MTPTFTMTLDVAQIALLGGLIWGLAKMSRSVDVLGEVTTGLTVGLKEISTALAELSGRVLVLEDRTPHRRP